MVGVISLHRVAVSDFDIDRTAAQRCVQGGTSPVVGAAISLHVGNSITVMWRYSCTSGSGVGSIRYGFCYVPLLTWSIATLSKLSSLHTTIADPSHLLN